MHVRLLIDGKALRHWHAVLLRRLAAVPGVDVAVDIVSGSSGLPDTADLLFQLEAQLYGLPRDGLAARIPSSALADFARPGPPADVTLDLCSSLQDHPGLWHLTFDSAEGEAALLALLLENRVPHLAIRDGSAMVATARVGTEHGGIALAAFEDVLARTITLIIAAVKGHGSAGLPVLPDETKEAPPAPLSRRRLAEAAAKQLARRIVRELYKLCCNAPHWKVGWRRLDGPDLFDLRHHPATGWQTLPDDGTRFYADPFAIAHDGTVTLFVEDYVHQLGKGIISAVACNAEGPLGPPRPVLELPYHLSYPFVFEREGQLWMIPESCAAGRVDLFRAERFPGGWVKEATLLDDVVASDATLIEHDGRWWLFATLTDGGGALSDALYLWSAPDFRGPYKAHERNPVLIDIASARPAGQMRLRDGALLRPVQDCRRGYGAALGIARVMRLNDEGFEQKVETIIGPGPAWPGRRLHTLNSAGGLEFIDGSAFAFRWQRRNIT